MKKQLVALLGSLLLTSQAALASFLPDNDLHLQDIPEGAGLTEEEFNHVIDLTEDFYGPLLRDSYGVTITFNRLWKNDTVNANAQQRGRNWIVNMYGGLARRPEITPDGFAMVLCHELGHHLGGFPFVSGWAANEGQSDLFATQSCGRIIFGDDAETNARYRNIIPTYPKNLCDEAWETEEEQNLCYRLMMASESTASLLGALRGNTVDFENTDLSIVTSTNDRHPAAQCRLDTYMAGALCAANFDPEVIPAKGMSGKNNVKAAEEESAKYTCSVINGDTQGIRPRCWFKSQFED